jgi:bifunctional DNA-binding transcriptional regulator/antitoxin component of YhaV-PrlF toxin-antitoxin module
MALNCAVIGAWDTPARTGDITVTAAAESQLTTCTYDGLHRLTGPGYSSGERFQYAHDAAGNMTAMTTTITSNVVTTKSYDAANPVERDEPPSLSERWRDATMCLIRSIVMVTVRFSKNQELVLPESLGKTLGLCEGDRVEVQRRRDVLTIDRKEAARPPGPLTDLARIISSSRPVGSADVEKYMDKHGYESVNDRAGI